MLVYVKNTYKPLRRSKRRADPARTAGKVVRIPVTQSKFDPVVRSRLHRETPHYPSLDTCAGSTAKVQTQQYTGTAMIGIGMMHKSNLVPIFSTKDAESISKMRRG